MKIFRQLFRSKCRPTVALKTMFLSLAMTTILIFFHWNWYYAVIFLRLNYPKMTVKDKWIPLGNNVTIFSAFYDDRAFRPNPVVVVLGLEKQSDRSTRYKCLLSNRNGKLLSLQHRAPLQILTRVHWVDGIDVKGKKILNYRPFSRTCRLPTNEIPKQVTIFSEKRSSKPLDCENCLDRDKGFEKFAVVHNRKQGRRKSFGVCISSPIFKIENPQELVNTFEMSRLLGAGAFTVYIYNESWELLEILEKYSRDGLVEVVDSWGVNFPGYAHYYGQLLSITDCLYRNIYKVKYLVYTDLDEVIVPLKHPDWSSLMRELDSQSKGSFNFEMVYLRAVEPSWTHKVNCPSGAEISLKSPRYATFRNRSQHVTGFTSRRTKYITKTDVTLIAQVHYVEKLVQGYVKENVPTDTGLLYHYRVPYSNSRFIKTWVIDRVVEKYLSRLFSAVEDVMCSLSNEMIL